MPGAALRSGAVRFARPALGSAEIDAVVAVLQSGWLTTGPRVERFEQEFAAWTGAPHAVAVSSCTAALHLALLASGIGAGDEVITTPLTFCATANVIEHVGATPVFADIDPQTWNIDPAAVETAITRRTRAVVPVHYAGRPADMTALRAIAARHDLAVIEDAAHAVEAVSNAGRVGATSPFTAFSFYSTKNLTTGEGGMITTASAERAAWIRRAALHGMSRGGWGRYAPGASPHYDVVMPGFKYNMMDLQAAIGLQQLARIEALHARRRAIWEQYDDAFADLPVTRPADAEPGTRHSRHLYTLLIEHERAGRSRDEACRLLQEAGIGISVHFRAIHLHSYYANRYGLTRGCYPHAERVSDTTLSLPLSAALEPDEAAAVIAAVRRLFD